MAVMNEWFKDWVRERNELDKKSVIVCNKWSFQTLADLTRECDDIAYISIAATDACALEYFHDPSEVNHYLPDSDNVLNINFDDLTEDFTFTNPFGEKITYCTISDAQAKQVVDFIDKNVGKHFVIHCRAGKSRSQAICRFIYDFYGDTYEPNMFNEHNACVTYNPGVFANVKKAFYKKNNVFNEN